MMLRTLLLGVTRDKLYALINITGLSLAMASCTVLGLYLRSELTYDQHHLKAERIYRVATEFTTKGSASRVATSAPQLGPLLAENFAEVQTFVRFSPLGANWETGSDRLIRHENQAFYWKDVYVTDDNVFDVFTHEILYGDPRSALRDPSSVAVSRTFAQKYFDNSNPVGETITLDNGEQRRITLVFADLPANTHLKYDALFSYNGLSEPQDETQRARALFAATDLTYVVMPENYDIRQFARLSETFFRRYMTGRAQEIHVDGWRAWLQPLKDIHLYSDVQLDLPTGNRYYLLGLGAAAAFLLLIACINHVNLATASAARRAREIGTRKTLGATRSALALQFMGESTLLSMAAFLVSVFVVAFLVPLTPIAGWLGTGVSLSPLRETGVLAAMAAFSLVIGALSGLYPALYLSAIAPLTAISVGDRIGGSGLRLRELLVLAQLTITACVIACTLLMVSQMRYVADRPLGFAKQGRLVVTLRGVAVVTQIPAIQQALGAGSRILGVTSSDVMIGQPLPAGFMDVETNDGAMDGVLVNHLPVAENFADVLGMEIVAGRNFSPELGTDRRGAIIVNEALVRLMGWKEPLGKRLGLRGRRVIGVVRDFHFKSLHTPIEPLVMYQNATNFQNIPPAMRAFKQQYLVLNVATERLAETLDFVGRTVRRFDAMHPFEYRFVDDTLNQLYLSEQHLLRLIGVFACICVFVACLGLLGLATFATARRTREIGIRKVLGASTGQILLLLSQRTLVLIAIGSVFAWVFAFVVMNQWLAAFAYRVDVTPTSFLAATAIVTIVALLTVSLQSLRAARRKPARALRHE